MIRSGRHERRFVSTVIEQDPNDIRDNFARDRDRILFSSAFRRLSGITQVIQPNGRYATHNRLTHSLEVAQISRSIAQHFVKRYSNEELNQYGGLDERVVEAAALAHDIGHPPFGHVSEKVLQATLTALPDSFEGNAQSFRAVTYLSSRFRDIDGLNLTRATLSAICKYPWLRDTDKDAKRNSYRKWNAYQTEKAYFEWSREHLPSYMQRVKTLEASIMDWADDIAYAVHDLEDFYRAGMIPLERLGNRHYAGKLELEEFVSDFYDGKSGAKFTQLFTLGEVNDRASVLLDSLQFSPYSGKREDRTVIRQFTSSFVSKYIGNTGLYTDLAAGLAADSVLEIDLSIQLEVALLKHFTVHYVIHSPALAAQRIGQKSLISSIANALLETLAKSETPPDESDDSSMDHAILEPFFLEVSRDLKANYPEQQQRVVADFICSLTEYQAISLGKLITGAGPFDSLRNVVG